MPVSYDIIKRFAEHPQIRTMNQPMSRCALDSYVDMVKCTTFRNGRGFCVSKIHVRSSDPQANLSRQCKLRHT